MSKATYPPRNTRQDENELGAYLRDLKDHPEKTTPLSREKEYELYERIKAGDLEARDELVEANLMFVINVAKKYPNRGLTLSELVSAGNLGLITAAERFDGTKGYKFISYAVWWIRQNILQALAEESRTVRLPINKIDLAKKISESSRNQEGPLDLKGMAKTLKTPEGEITDAILAGQRELSLDEELEEDDERTLCNILSSNEPTPEDVVTSQSSIKKLNTELARLDDRGYQILRMYFGLDCEEPLTLEQVGQIMGITRERVRQLKDVALQKLRHPARTSSLRKYHQE